MSIYSTDGGSFNRQIVVNHLRCWLARNLIGQDFHYAIRIFLFVQPAFGLRSML